MENWKNERMEVDIRTATEKIRREAEERANFDSEVTEEIKLEKAVDKFIDETKDKSFWGKILERFSKYFVLFFFVILYSSCTENSKSRSFGGTQTIELKPNEIALNVTWKGEDVWICTKDTCTGIVYFREKSNWGILDGTIILK